MTTLTQRFTCIYCHTDVTRHRVIYVVPPVSEDRIVCVPCGSGKNRNGVHARLFVDCGVTWHDIWDHSNLPMSAAGAQLLFEPLPQQRDDMGIGDLITLGLCSAACLLAQEGAHCRCRCGGRWHGTLLALDVQVHANNAHATP